VPEIAHFLGRSRQSLYYHVQALHDCGLLLESGVRAEGRKKTRLYDLPGRPFIVRYDITTPRTRKAVLALGRIRLRSGLRGFVRACRPEIAVTEGPRRNLWVTHWKGWLTVEELEEANRLLMRLVEVFRHRSDAPGGPRTPHELTFALAPVISAEP
jgi:biotin operon repressor